LQKYLEKSPLTKPGILGFTPGEIVKGVKEAAPKVGQFLKTQIPESIGTTVKNIFNPTPANAPAKTSNLLGFNIPANLGFNFQLPEFNLNKFAPPSFTSAPTAGGGRPTIAGVNLPKVDFLGGVKRIASSVGTGISNLYKSTIGRIF
jgi:hypothetical protein